MQVGLVFVPDTACMTLQCMRLVDHVTLNFNNNMSTAGVFLDIEKPLIQLRTLAYYINYQI
jgi:hypothetical protein